MGDYIGVITLDNPIYCLKEVSGKEYKSTIAGNNVLFIFPSIPTDYDVTKHDLNYGDLTVPGDLFKGKVNWGMVKSFPNMVFSVNSFLSYFSGESSEVSNIYEAFPRWKDKLNRLHTIYRGNYLQPIQKTPNIIQGGGFDDGLQMFEISENKKLQYINNSRTIETISLHLIESKEAYSSSEISNLFANASLPNEIALAYELLINAYNAMKCNDFRSAVILAGTAVEKAILNRMSQEYTIDTDFEKDKNSHRMLGGKFRWLTDKNIYIPNAASDYQSSIIDVRNDAAHDGIRPSYSQTKQCLEKSKILIETYNSQVLE